jgi:hypothetical protein
MKNDANMPLADDLLVGAPAIAKFVFGSDDVAAVRRTYHLAGTKNLPTFKLGALLAARKSTLLKLGVVAGS